MPHIRSRVNGLRIDIPNDARGVIHRFAIGGGGNELVFEPITRKAFEQSAAASKAPVGIGSSTHEAETVAETLPVVLTQNVVDDDDDEAKPPKAKRQGRSAKVAEEIL